MNKPLVTAMLGAILVLAACGPSSEVSTPLGTPGVIEGGALGDPGGPTLGGSQPGGDLVAAAAALDDARQRWAQAALTDYRFTLSYACNCAFRGPYEITVQAGGVVGAVPGRAEVDPPPTGDTQRILTIDGLHALIAEAIAQGANAVAVTYDQQGVPTAALIDYLGNAIDDELGFSAELSG